MIDTAKVKNNELLKKQIEELIMRGSGLREQTAEEREQSIAISAVDIGRMLKARMEQGLKTLPVVLHCLGERPHNSVMKAFFIRDGNTGLVQIVEDSIEGSSEGRVQVLWSD